MALSSDPVFLPELFARLRAARPGDATWADLVAFLQELCSLTKHLQPQHRSQLLAKLASLGLFEVSHSTGGSVTFRLYLYLDS